MDFLLADKIEAALAALIAPVVSGPQILTGKSSQEKLAPPIIVCSAEETGDEEPIHWGNFWVGAAVEIKCAAVFAERRARFLRPSVPVGPPRDGPKDADQDLVSAVFTAIRVDNLAARLNVIGQDMDFTVFPGSVIFEATVRSREGASGAGKDFLWVDRLAFRCLACGSALAE
jgi:hypothetical protein